MKTFELKRKEIDFLRENYHKEDIVQKVLKSEENGVFVVSIDIKLDFMDFLENESVATMDKDYEPTKATLVLESIRDKVYYQTN